LICRSPFNATSLATALPKETDRRAFSGLTCQAEALAPDVLAQILRGAIENRIDLDVLNRVRHREKSIQRQLLKQLGGWHEQPTFSARQIVLET
jgi:hypothetical protein